MSVLYFTIEYTKTSPCVCSYYNLKSNYIECEANLGYPIGLNQDENLSELFYDINEWLTMFHNYRNILSDENMYDTSGTLIKNKLWR